ncbi:ribonuclease III [Hyphomicrobium sp. LHD-15]|jgi:ribonuclease-3|uniref:ribonuclease III n=1 Tax=Hyphomicrobium sp. LHD-15 TaxID=3072142 RepID=UPI00280DE6BC|nr:ribonuclease III [Hyphomicrobium sp. LHD-15]MDQ8697891.1 ribonuclease III [Hyphomicrobium sp. LHD-15]
MFKARKYKELEKKLGYRFKNEALLTRALTHASLRGSKKVREDNERLEFVGDRVLGLAIVELLWETYPVATEGELARHLNRLVRGETCAKVGRALALGDFLMLSDSEAGSGGRLKATILADAVEAVLGAIFLEAGFNKARDVVRRLWENEEVSFGHAAADPKSALQEWAQGQGLQLPAYVEVERTGPDHAPRFTSEVRIKGKAPARGEGASKRAAEQAAATALLEREGVMEKREIG